MLSQQRQHITVKSASAAAITAIQRPVVIRGNRMDEAPGKSDYWITRYTSSQRPAPTCPAQLWTNGTDAVP
jgi:hypothetical protein